MNRIIYALKWAIGLTAALTIGPWAGRGFSSEAAPTLLGSLILFTMSFLGGLLVYQAVKKQDV